MKPSPLPPLPDRPIKGHKGLFGRILIVGGSDTMLGAPVLAGLAALRMGSGLVQIALPAHMLPAALSVTPELIGINRTTSGREVLEAAEQADVVVIGPGLGQSAESKKLLMALLKLDQSMVIDADALNILARGDKWPSGVKASCVLTPHPGEMKRLGGLIGVSEVPDDDAGRRKLAKQASEAFSQVVVLKGYRTIITNGKRVVMNPTGDSSLSKAGTGDVLSGMIGALIGQGMSLFEAAVAGCHLHGKAGELAGRQLGRRSVLASDVIAALPRAIQMYDRKRHR